MYYRCDCVDCCDAIVLWFHLLMSSSRHVHVMRRLMQKRRVSRNKNRESLLYIIVVIALFVAMLLSCGLIC